MLATYWWICENKHRLHSDFGRSVPSLLGVSLQLHYCLDSDPDDLETAAALYRTSEATPSGALGSHAHPA
jgi:hypothetical protein